MIRYLYVALLLISVQQAIGQVVSVKDAADLQPIANMFIYSERGFSVLTDENGKADVSAFIAEVKDTDTDKDKAVLMLQHPSYLLTVINLKQLEERGFELLLKESVIDLNEVVVGATRWEESRNKIPQTVATISSKDVVLQNPQTSADLLATSGKVFVQKSQLGGGSPMIRGFSANRLLIAVDGVRMNNAIYRSGNLQNVISIDPHAVGNTEVIFGPGSVMYGSDAIGGVMLFSTTVPKFTDTKRAKVWSNALMRYSTANKENTGHVDLNIGWRKWSFLSSATLSDYRDLRMGANGPDEYLRPNYVDQFDGQDTMLVNDDPLIQRRSGYRQLNLLQKVRFKPNEHLEFNYAFHFSRTGEVPRYDRLIEYAGDQLKFADWYYGPQEWDMHSLSIAYTQPSLLFDKMRMVAAYQKYGESRHDRKFGKEALRNRYEQVDVLSFNWDLDKRINEDHELLYGAEFVYNKVGSTGFELDLEDAALTQVASRYPDGATFASMAAYLNFKANITNDLTFIGGARYSQVLLDALFDNTFFDFPFEEVDINTGAINGSMGFAYRPTPHWQFNLNVATGFRAPNVDDVGKIFDSEPGSVVVPNDELDSEYAYSGDLSIVRTFGERVQLEATGFYTLLRNAMVRRDFTFNGMDSILYDGTLSQVQAVVNAEAARVYGGQFGIAARLTDWMRITSQYSITKGFDQDNIPLRHASPNFGSTHLIFEPNRTRLDFYAVYNGALAFEQLAPTEQAKPHIYAMDANGDPYSPAWVTFNMKASYQVNTNIRLQFGFENVMDLRYRPYSSGIVAPGRNIILGLRAAI